MGIYAEYLSAFNQKQALSPRPSTPLKGEPPTGEGGGKGWPKQGLVVACSGTGFEHVAWQVGI